MWEMKIWIFGILALYIFSSKAFSQELVKPEFPLPDSTKSDLDETSQDLTEPVFILHPDEIYTPGKFSLELKASQMPKIDFNQRLFNFLQDYSYSINNPGGSPVYSGFSANNPFIYNGAVFNQAAYKISNRLTIGGSSYGYNDIYSAPLPNSMNQFNSRGASMFFEYKVSKNIKIETRVSVNSNQF
jgi:hypothetical protein